MGTLVFPAAQVKIFLTASAKERAKRRYNQLKEKGLDANLVELATALHERDERDRTRSVAPLKAAAAALVVESTGLSIADVFEQIYAQVVTIFPELAV
jgi:cytidylate kinase